MKMYCKIKMDGKWNWMSADDPWKVATAQALCECRVCKPAEPNVVSQEEDECGCIIYVGDVCTCNDLPEHDDS